MILLLSGLLGLLAAMLVVFHALIRDLERIEQTINELISRIAEGRKP